jgi:hypothetical protein
MAPTRCCLFTLGGGSNCMVPKLGGDMYCIALPGVSLLIVAGFGAGRRLTNSQRDVSMTIDTIATWHKLLATKDVGGLDALLADNAVFHSPIVHSPQVGKALTQRYLAAAFGVFGNESFRYVREVIGKSDAVLEFQVEINGISVNGVDMIKWDGDGKIVEFKVMLRPLKAINLIHQKMAAMLQPMH